jgi:hypothetical protein
MKKNKYWYQTEVYICVLCGKEVKYKHRVYTPKPKRYEFRYLWYDDACPEHFM